MKKRTTKISHDCSVLSFYSAIFPLLVGILSGSFSFSTRVLLGCPYFSFDACLLLFGLNLGAFSITQALAGRLGRGSISQALGSRDGIEPMGSSVCTLALGWHVSMEENLLQTSDEMKPDGRLIDRLSVDSAWNCIIESIVTHPYETSTSASLTTYLQDLGVL